MENSPAADRDRAHPIDLLPGFRFYPTDEELIKSYLLPRTLDVNFVALAIGEADLRRLEPWELPSVAKMGEEEWYFYCLRERRYPRGPRTNRGTEEGYWKATGKDKEIYSGNSLVGMKKTLVFYQGRPPKGVKSNWVMHEYRLDGEYSKDNLPQSAQCECVISRVFHKNPSGKKTHISALPPAPNSRSDNDTSLPPLIPYSPSCIGGCESMPPEITPKNADDLSWLSDFVGFPDSSIPTFLFYDFRDGTVSGLGGGGGHGAGDLGDE